MATSSLSNVLSLDLSFAVCGTVRYCVLLGGRMAADMVLRGMESREGGKREGESESEPGQTLALAGLATAPDPVPEPRLAHVLVITARSTLARQVSVRLDSAKHSSTACTHQRSSSSPAARSPLPRAPAAPAPCASYMPASCSAVVAFSMPLSSRTRMKRGNRIETPRSPPREARAAG